MQEHTERTSGYKGGDFLVFPKLLENRGVYNILYFGLHVKYFIASLSSSFFFVNLIHFSSISCSRSFILVLHIFYIYNFIFSSISFCSI
jgi:hypothetical protein